jgi:dihydrodipicolinate synthase/N-acetylneuraminate lyase
VADRGAADAVHANDIPGATICKMHLRRWVSMAVKTRYPQGLLVSCELPWDEHEKLVEGGFREAVRHFLKLGFRHVYIFGTAGEGYAVTNQNFERIVEIFAEETAHPEIHPQIGIIGLSTSTVLERIQIAYRAGFRTFQISLPSWGALNDREMLRFFREVCGAYPDSQFLHYNLARSKRLLGAADYRSIADVVPNLVATKNTSPNISFASELMRLVPELQHFFGEATFPGGALHGECSLLSSFAPLFPSATLRLFELARTRQIEPLFDLQRDYLTAVWTTIAPMMKKEHIDGAYDKALMRLGGFPMPLRLLSPYESISEEVYEECRRILEEKYSSWIG